MGITIHIKNGWGITEMTETRPTWAAARMRAVHLFATFPDIEIIAATCDDPKGSAMWEFDLNDQVLVESFSTGVVQDGPGEAPISVGDVVKIHPACDAWMQGFTSGTVTKVGTKWIHVKWTFSDRVKKFSRQNVEVV